MLRTRNKHLKKNPHAHKELDIFPFTSKPPPHSPLCPYLAHISMLFRLNWTSKKKSNGKFSTVTHREIWAFARINPSSACLTFLCERAHYYYLTNFSITSSVISIQWMDFNQSSVYTTAVIKILRVWKDINTPSYSYTITVLQRKTSTIKTGF